MVASMLQNALSAQSYFGTTPTVSFLSPSVAGNLLIMVIEGYTNNATWTLPSGWTLAGSYSGGGGSWIYYYENNPGGIIAVTPTASVTTYAQLTMFEFSGFGTGVFDTGARTVANAASASLTITSGSDVNANDLIIAAFSVYSSGGGQTVTAATGWSTVQGNFENGVGTTLTEWNTASATGAQTATGASTGSVGYDAVIATFKIGSAAVYYEEYANQDSGDSATYSTLNGGITATAPTLTVHSASVYSAKPNFRIKIDKELMRVIGIAGNVLTISRGQEGTTAAIHADTTPVYEVLTAAGLNASSAKFQILDQYSNRPTPQYPGRVFRDKTYPLAWRDNGSSWDAFGPMYPLSPVPVILGGSWTWVNQGAATVDESYGKPYFQQPTGAFSDNLHLLVRTIPSAPYSLTLGILPNLMKVSNAVFGMCLYDSGSGKVITFAFKFGGSGAQLESDKWNSPTSYSGNYNTRDFFLPPVVWLRVLDDNTNRVFSFSSDGVHFLQFYSVSRTDFITPDKIGVVMSQNGNEGSAGMTLLSWNGVA